MSPAPEPPPVVELSGVLEADPGAVWEVLVEARRRGDVGDLQVDDERREVLVEGGWWYRGRDLVAPHERGARLTHTVSNRATGASRWVAQLVHVRAHRRIAREEFAFLVGSLGQRLGCRTWVPGPEPS